MITGFQCMISPLVLILVCLCHGFACTTDSSNLKEGGKNNFCFKIKGKRQSQQLQSKVKCSLAGVCILHSSLLGFKNLTLSNSNEIAK